MEIEILVRADSLGVNNEEQLHQWNSEEIIIPSWRKSRPKIITNFVLATLSCLLVQTAFLLNANGRIFNYYANVEHKFMTTLVGAKQTRNDYAQFIDTLNENKLSLILLLANFFCKLLDCIVLPRFLLTRYGPKATMLVSFASYLVYYTALFYSPLKQFAYLGI
jgi:hypothetical protein